MSQAIASPQTDMVEGVYLCEHLDLPALFGAEIAAHPGLRLYRPEEVPDPHRIRFALAWRPAPDAFAHYPNLELVQVIAAGVDTVLGTPSLPATVAVARVEEAEQAAVMAGFAAWHVVWHHRRMGAYLDAAARAEWRRVSFQTLRPPSQVPVGVLGYGLMGRQIARAVAAMGFPVLAASRRDGPADMGVTRVTGTDAVGRVAERAEILVNVLPLTDETRDILATPLFDRMPAGAALIQLGRGEQMIEEDLLTALASGRIGGASVDVFRHEPLPADHPFWAHPKIVVTPHEASLASAAAVAGALAQSVRDMLAGRPPATAVHQPVPS